MRIITNPTRGQLEKAQLLLGADSKAEFQDIWASDIFGKVEYFVVEEFDEIIGFMSLHMMDEDAEIHKLYISPRFRKSGFARKLFTCAMARFSELGIRDVHIEWLEGSFNFWNQMVMGYDIKNIYGINKFIIQIGKNN